MSSDSDFAVSVHDDSEDDSSSVGDWLTSDEELNQRNECADVSSSDTATDEEESAAMYTGVTGMKAALFSQTDCCPLQLEGVERLAGSKYPYNPKLPNSESFLSESERAEMHFLVFHCITKQLITHGFMNFTHKRVSVKKHLVRFGCTLTVKQEFQVSLAQRCLQTLVALNAPCLTNHEDYNVWLNGMCTNETITVKQELKDFLEYTETNRFNSLPGKFRHLALLNTAREKTQLLCIQRHLVQILTAASRPKTHKGLEGLGLPIAWSTLLQRSVTDPVTSETFDSVMEWFVRCWYARAKRHICEESSIQAKAAKRMNSCLPPGFDVQSLGMTWQPTEETFQLSQATKRNVAVSFLAGTDACAALAGTVCEAVENIVEECCENIGKSHNRKVARSVCVNALQAAQRGVATM